VLFWSGICSHCVRYDQYLNGFGAQHKEVGLVAFASRHGETADMVRKAIQERKLLFPILPDRDGSVAERWFTQQTPRAFLIGSDGKLLYRGAIDNFKYPGDPQYIDYLEACHCRVSRGRPVSRAETAGFGCAIQSIYYILPKSLRARLGRTFSEFRPAFSRRV
jgi:hypothetical protein